MFFAFFFLDYILWFFKLTKIMFVDKISFHIDIDVIKNKEKELYAS